MIRLRRIPDSSWEEIFEQCGVRMPDDFLVSPKGSAASAMLVLHNRDYAVLNQFSDGNTAEISIYMLVHDISDAEKRRIVNWVTERAVKTSHPQKIVMTSALGPKVMNGCGYYAKGKRWQKVIEPWRSLLSDSVFDQEGYIINQGLMKDIPFGWFDTQAKGCGWIAAYNLLKLNGREKTMQECVEQLQKHAFLGDVMGQDLPRLVLWLKKQGLAVKLTPPLNSKAAAVIPESTGIILYTHNRGGHYVAYKGLGNGKAVFYNGIYGRTKHIQDASAYLKERSLFPFSTVIYVPGEKSQ